MFLYCSGLTTLDVSAFNTSNVTNMSWMFYACSGLTTIYASEKFVTMNVSYSGSMFSDCTNLVGGRGTKANGGPTDKTCARIDGGTYNPGYFTEKQT